jgi:hypothetical protein
MPTHTTQVMEGNWRRRQPEAKKAAVVKQVHWLRAVSSAAAVGSTSPSAAAQRAASGTRRATAATASVSAFRGLYLRGSLPFFGCELIASTGEGDRRDGDGSNRLRGEVNR